MKLPACATVCAAALALARADECTSSDLAVYESSDDLGKVKAACVGLELNEYSQPKDYREFCKNPTCLTAIKAAQAALPNCTAQGVLLSEVYSPEVMDKECEEFTKSTTTGATSSMQLSGIVVLMVSTVALAVGSALL